MADEDQVQDTTAAPADEVPAADAPAADAPAADEAPEDGGGAPASAGE